MRCRQCGRVYVGEHTYTRCYKCAGRKKAYAPVERFRNKSWRADILENIIWAELEKYLSDRDLIANEIERQHQEAGRLKLFEDEPRVCGAAAQSGRT